MAARLLIIAMNKLLYNQTSDDLPYPPFLIRLDPFPLYMI